MKLIHTTLITKINRVASRGENGCFSWLAFARVQFFVPLVLAILLLTACDLESPKKINHIGIVLFGDSRQPQVNGFKQGLAELGYIEGKDVQYSIRNAKNDRKIIPNIVKGLLDDHVDLLVAAGGLEADDMKKIAGPQNIPVVVLYVNSIVERGLVKSRTQPGWSVTGVDNLNAELSGKRVELLKDLIPDIRKILILYYEKIPPSRIGVQIAIEAASKNGILVDARPVSSREEIQQVMTSLNPGDVDAMLTVPTAPIDNALTDSILPNTRRLGIPLFTHSRPLSEKGATASYGAHFFDLGKQSARLADKVLSGVNPEKIPFETPKEFKYTINQKELEALNHQLNVITKSQANDYIAMDQ